MNRQTDYQSRDSGGDKDSSTLWRAQTSRKKSRRLPPWVILLRKVTAGGAVFFLVLSLSGCPGLLAGGNANSNSSDGDTEQPDDDTEQPDDDTDTQSPADVPEKFWGTWVRMDGRNITWYISDTIASIAGVEVETSVLGGSSLSAGGVALERLSDNIIAASVDGALSFYLFRRSGPTASVRASVRDTTGALLSGVALSATNTKNPSNVIKAVTDGNGEVTLTGVILGDEYTVAAAEGTSAAATITISPSFDGQKIGSVTVADVGYTAIVRHTVTNASASGHIYAGDSFGITITVENTGADSLPSFSYSVTSPEGLSLNGPVSQSVDAISAGGATSIELSATATSFDAESRDFEIPIEVTTSDGTTWKSTVSVRVFGARVSISLTSVSAELRAVVISPDNTSNTLRTNARSAEAELPSRTEPYLLAVASKGYQVNTKYALRLNEQPTQTGVSLTDETAGEPNDAVGQASAVYLGSDYLGAVGNYDLDLYAIRESVISGQEITWSGISPQSGETVNITSPTFSWDVVLGVTAYEVQTATSSAGFDGAPTQRVDTNSYTPETGFPNGGPSFWRTRAEVENGEYTAWSPAYSVQIDWDTTINGLSPTGGGDVSDTTPTLSWDELLGAATYDIEIARETDVFGGTPDNSTSTNGFTVKTPLSKGESYKWRVRPVDTGGQTGPWTAAQSFALPDYFIGEAGPAGGVVFYDKGTDSDGWRYLEAAPSDQSAGVQWRRSIPSDSFPNSTAIGTGESNTSTLLEVFGGGTYAAYVASNYTLNDYSDWFLPSLQELKALQSRRSVVGDFRTVEYWSSSRDGFSSTRSWTVDFINGFPEIRETDTARRVRAIRSFSAN